MCDGGGPGPSGPTGRGDNYGGGGGNAISGAPVSGAPVGAIPGVALGDPNMSAPGMGMGQGGMMAGGNPGIVGGPLGPAPGVVGRGLDEGLNNPGLASNIQGQNLSSPTAGSLPGSGFADPGPAPGVPSITPPVTDEFLQANKLTDLFPTQLNQDKPTSFLDALNRSSNRNVIMNSLIAPFTMGSLSTPTTIMNALMEYGEGDPNPASGRGLQGGVDSGFGVGGGPAARPPANPVSAAENPLAQDTSSNIVFQNGQYYNRFTGQKVTPDEFFQALSGARQNQQPGQGGLSNPPNPALIYPTM